MKHDQALNTLETTLMGISMTAEVVSLALLAVIRYVRKLKRATVENLWLWSSRRWIFKMLREEKGEGERNLDGPEYNPRLQYSI